MSVAIALMAAVVAELVTRAPARPGALVVAMRWSPIAAVVAVPLDFDVLPAAVELDPKALRCALRRIQERDDVDWLSAARASHKKRELHPLACSARFSILILVTCEDCSEMQRITPGSRRDRLFGRRAPTTAGDPKLRDLGIHSARRSPGITAEPRPATSTSTGKPPASAPQVSCRCGGSGSSEVMRSIETSAHVQPGDRRASPPSPAPLPAPRPASHPPAHRRATPHDLASRRRQAR
jgi:hypothetical protein